MREPQSGREYADASMVESVLGEFIATVQSGHTVPLTKDGNLVAVVVSPEVAAAGLRALGREG